MTEHQALALLLMHLTDGRMPPRDVIAKADQAFDDAAEALARPTAPAAAQGDAAAESGAIWPKFDALSKLDGRYFGLSDKAPVVVNTVDGTESLGDGWLIVRDDAFRCPPGYVLVKRGEHANALSAAPAPQAETPSAGMPQPLPMPTFWFQGMRTTTDSALHPPGGHASGGSQSWGCLR